MGTWSLGTNGMSYEAAYGKKYEAYTQMLKRQGISGEELKNRQAAYAQELQKRMQLVPENKARGKEYAKMLAEEKKALEASLKHSPTSGHNPPSTVGGNTSGHNPPSTVGGNTPSRNLPSITEHKAPVNKKVSGGCLKKLGKWGAIALVGLGIYSLFKNDDKKNSEPAKLVNDGGNPAGGAAPIAGNDSTKVVNDSTKVASVPVAGNDSTKVENDYAAGVAPDDKNETQKNSNKNSKTENTSPAALPVTEDGKYTTQKGDSFWKIAEKHLKDKYRNEPEKFADLPKQQQYVKIQIELERIMKLNDYWYDENHYYSAPMLHPNVELIIEDFDAAA